MIEAREIMPNKGANFEHPRRDLLAAKKATYMIVAGLLRTLGSGS